MRTLILTAAAAAAVASCTTAPPVPQAARAEQKLQQMLAGKVAGPPTGCISAIDAANASSTIAPNAIAFRVNPGLVYVSNTAGSACQGLAGDRYALVTRSSGPGGLCRGDIVQVRDLQTGIMVGSCSLGEFTRYSRP